jgi:hypothetical protein
MVRKREIESERVSEKPRMSAFCIQCGQPTEHKYMDLCADCYELEHPKGGET